VIAGLSGRIVALIAAAVVIVVVLIGWVLLISPQRSKAADLGTTIDDTRAKIAETQAYVSSPATRRNVRDLNRLKELLPDTPRMSQILRQLTAASGASGVRINSLTPSAPIASSGAQAVPIALSVQGHYFGISKFLHILRTEAYTAGTAIRGKGRLYSIDGIQFSNGGTTAPTPGATSGGSATGSITASLTVNAFLFGAPIVAPPPPTTTGSSTTG
jgi:Pilus assembly protein, PilO